MKKILLKVLTCIRWMKSKYYTFLFKQMLHSYGSVGVNNYCKIARTATVDVGKKFSSNGLTISGLGGVKVGDYFHSGTNCKIMLGSHDYDNGDAIPYGLSKVRKQVIAVPLKSKIVL